LEQAVVQGIPLAAVVVLVDILTMLVLFFQQAH
jgi:hypothetical protein